MMLKSKMQTVMDDVNNQVAERQELIECIAVALLTGRNLFILGDTGQAKSYAINEFRKRITGAKQFERLLSKQTDEEMLFGRIDLGSLIPGYVSQTVLSQSPQYQAEIQSLLESFEKYTQSGDDDVEIQCLEKTKRMEIIAKVLSAVQGNTPQMITTGKIPDSHIVFLDEIFKANDGILNSLLTALNERKYTNEGETVRKYTRAKKLTERMLNELIEQIEVHQAEKIEGLHIQRLTIHYSCIGAIQIPDMLTLPEIIMQTRKGVKVKYSTEQTVI
ncbi:MAG: DUF4368 domain-containing protein [Oscillospiraceae bacterium]|nr:DUF4368 domain-containing protein [Oscillospiraceae bacterium]